MFNEFILQSFRLIHLLRKWKDCQKLLNQKFRNKNGKSYPTRIVKTPKFVQTCSFNISCTNGLSCLYIFMKVWWAVSCCVHTEHPRTQSTGSNYHGWIMKFVSYRKILWNALKNDRNTVKCCVQATKTLLLNSIRLIARICLMTRTSLLLWKLKKTRDLYKELYSGLYSPKGLHMLFCSVVPDRKCVYKV